MTHMTTAAARDRINATQPESPLAVFRLPNTPDRVDVTFANTTGTTLRIKQKDPLYVGSFSKDSNKMEVLAKLEIAVDRSRNRQPMVKLT